jgi:hypothetical protein
MITYPAENGDAGENSRLFAGAGIGRTAAFAVAIFTSAFLLFQVQPLISKIILPWFGGVAAVWTVCLLFFQVVLLLGYFYAHCLTKYLQPRVQGRIHCVLLAASFLALPILPKSSWRPASSDAPSLHILLLLMATVGMPYFLLSATSPLLQAWYARERSTGARTIYRFYAISNAGSMIALLSYPVLVEPRFSTLHQASGWSIAYAMVAVGCGALALSATGKQAATGVAESASPPESNVDGQGKLIWVVLAACGSALLLATTNHISQNIAAVPLLWVIPLSLYLLSFILCFEGHGWYQRDFFLRLLGVALGSMAYALSPSFPDLPWQLLIPLYCAGLFICCMFCHGELARLKPHSSRLTEFYLLCSLGGALGAVFVALVAPHVFSGYYELHCALALCAALIIVVHFRDPQSTFYPPRLSLAWIVMVGLVLALGVNLVFSVREQIRQAHFAARNFYGALRVVDYTNPASREEGVPAYRKLLNGTIDHGLQFFAPNLQSLPTAYYAPNSGIGVTLKAAGERRELRVGVIGLGAGTIAAYGRAGDRYTFYEINPLVVRVASEQFNFLKNSSAQIDIVMGDARLSLERQQPQNFDVLAVDAFSGDSIPVHLLTREAFELYFRHLKPDGIVAVHVSNQHLNLRPVVEAAAASLGREAIMIDNGDDHPQGIYASSWILLGSPEAFSSKPDIETAGSILPPSRGGNLWTDDYSSLFKVLK